MGLKLVYELCGIGDIGSSESGVDLLGQCHQPGKDPSG
jgi:hypothetical protein